MSRVNPAGQLGLAVVFSVAAGLATAAPVRVDSGPRGVGEITVFGKGVDVRVTDPVGRVAWWKGDTLVNDIPECDAMGEEPIAEEGSTGDSNPQTSFNLNKLVPGDYEVRVKARQDVGVYLWVDRFSDKNARASADGRAELKRGRVAVWKVAWGCTERSDTCWAIARQVQGPKTKQR